MSLDRLAGAWNLRSFEFTDSGGNVFRPLGDRPEGSLVVVQSGHAVLSFAAADRTQFATSDLFAGTDEERAAAAAGYISFGGPAEITDDAITIQVEYSLFPNWVGGTQTRLYELDGDTLTLRTPGPRLFGGAERSAHAVLQRA